MKKALTFLLTITTYSFSSLSLSQEFIGGATAGMTPQEVVNSSKGASIIKNGSTLGTGAVELVRKENYEVVGEEFTKKFYFVNNRLNQVTLSLEEERGFSSTIMVFESLVEALRAKYGKEVNYSIEPSGLLKTAEADWYTNSGVNIAMLVMAVDNHDATLNVNYQTRVSEEASKL